MVFVWFVYHFWMICIWCVCVWVFYVFRMRLYAFWWFCMIYVWFVYDLCIFLHALYMISVWFWSSFIISCWWNEPAIIGTSAFGANCMNVQLHEVRAPRPCHSTTAEAPCKNHTKSTQKSYTTHTKNHTTTQAYKFSKIIHTSYTNPTNIIHKSHNRHTTSHTKFRYNLYKNQTVWLLYDLCIIFEWFVYDVCVSFTCFVCVYTHVDVFVWFMYDLYIIFAWIVYVCMCVCMICIWSLHVFVCFLYDLCMLLYDLDLISLFGWCKTSNSWKARVRSELDDCRARRHSNSTTSELHDCCTRKATSIQQSYRKHTKIILTFMNNILKHTEIINKKHTKSHKN